MEAKLEKLKKHMTCSCCNHDKEPETIEEKDEDGENDSDFESDKSS